MKIKIFLLIALIAICSCKKSTNDNTIDETKIKNQVKEVVTGIFKGCEEVNATQVLQSCFDSPDFVYLFNGTTKSYQEFSSSLAGVYDLMLSQEITLITEKYAVLDESTVLYTTNLTFLQHYKDGHDNFIDPAVMLFIFKKINGNWRWIYGVESYG